MVKRPLVENVDAAPFGGVPKLLDDNRLYSVLHLASLHWFQATLPCSAGGKAEDMGSESSVTCHSPEL